jgi:hypothetical protein
MTAEYTTWQLARMAGVSDPDSHDDSPGAKFLRRVESSASEIAENVADGYDLDDQILEVADALVPVYTHEVWKVFVDLAAYEVEVETDMALESDMTKRAQVALYEVARTLLTALLIEQEEGDDA